MSAGDRVNVIDLVAESRLREAQAADLAGRLPYPKAGRPPSLDGPADPYVFSDFTPRTDPVPRGYPLRYCTVHPGVQWYGVSPCFACEEAERG